jgi:hypothetical protein
MPEQVVVNENIGKFQIQRDEELFRGEFIVRIVNIRNGPQFLQYIVTKIKLKCAELKASIDCNIIRIRGKAQAFC